MSKEVMFKSESKRVQELLPTEKKRRAYEEATQKGVSSWLSVLPLASLGYSLNKKEFRNSIRVRYDWDISDMPNFCACGKKNDIDHALTCKLGGYVHLRHDVLVETEAELLIEAKCKNVQTEPALLTTSPELHPAGTNTADGARLDIAATGLFGRCERTLMDVRVTHANAPSNRSLSFDKLYAKNENEKKTKYLSRVINTEKSSFIPLVFSTAGGTAPECDRFHKRVAELIAHKRKENYSHVISYVRTKVRFALLKSVLIAIHGIRGRNYKNRTSYPISDISFGLIPTEETYECR